MGTEVVMGRWGTWEELLLGGAVLRHGTLDWDVVAAELRTRAVCPYSFTPEVCKAKYEDLQRRYSGCTTWFEELRKQRMVELRQALEKSADSIGSLESQLETLKAEKGDCHIDYGSSQTESPVPFRNSERVESSGQEASKDGPSAGSFTQETHPNWSAECQNQAAMSSEEMETKLESLEPLEKEKVLAIDNLAETVYSGQGANVKKRRGKRKRKDCSRDVKEASVGESDFLGLADIVIAPRSRENSTSDCGEVARTSGADDRNRGLSNVRTDDLMEIFDSVVENGNAPVFRRRLDSQKRGRYKKMVRQHMDFDTIRSRIASRSITSAREVFRDLLLLANNALVFYSKNTRKHKTALLLRDLTTKTLQQHYKNYGIKATSDHLSSKAPMSKPPVKPRSIRPGNRKLSGYISNAGNAVARTSHGGKKSSNADSPPSMESVAVAKKGSGRPRKAGRRTASQQSVTPTKGRKRVWTR